MKPDSESGPANGTNGTDRTHESYSSHRSYGSHPTARHGEKYSFRLPLAKWALRINEPLLLIALGAVVGVFTGFVTVGYRLAVHYGNAFLVEGVARNETGGAAGATGPLGLTGHALLVGASRLFLPAIGGLAVGLLLRWLHRPTALTGVPAILRAMQTGDLRLPNRLALASASSVVILATGGSAGPEGPIVEIGSVMGAQTGRFLGLPPRTLRVLIASGVAAGIASVFNSPLGGVFFALEVIIQEYALASFAPVLMASVFSSMITQIFIGDIPAIDATPRIMGLASHFWELPLFCLLGAAMGGLSIAFIKSIDAVGALSARVRAPVWLKPAMGGLCVGLIGFFMPEIMGEGYSFLNRALDSSKGTFSFLAAMPGGVALAAVFLCVAVAKIVATSLTLGSGAPGGSFAPGVFVGGMAGMCMGSLIHAAWPQIDPAAYGLMGMAGMISGMFNAPFTAIMIVMRLTQGNYKILLPLMSTVALSVFVMHHWQNVSIYTWTLRKLGLPWGQKDLRDPLVGMTVGQVCAREFMALEAAQTVSAALDALRDTDQHVFAVRAAEGRCAGTLTLSDLRLAFQDFEMSRLLTLSDLVDAGEPRLLAATPLRDAIHLLSDLDKEGAAVYDAESAAWPIGIVTRASILEAYHAQRGET